MISPERTPRNYWQLFRYFCLLFGGFTMMAPFLWMIATSLKGPNEAFLSSRLIPKQLVFSNYLEVWRTVPFGRFFINSLVVTCAIVVGQLITSSLAAFAFARLRFPGRGKLFICYLATMMVPGTVTMIPVFIILKFLGRLCDYQLFLGPINLGNVIGLDSYFALIVPGLFSPFGVFLLRQFFLTIPTELEDAARIDGCGTFRIFWSVILPLSGAAQATLTIFAFMGGWRDFMWPLIVTHSLELNTLTLGVASFQGLYLTNWPYLMAGAIMVIVPMLIVFLFNQRYFVEGIKLSGLKG
jgi:multiple sugar transport system permease protein